MYTHNPVLLKEAIEFLNPKSGANFIDATLGGGGYTSEILEKNGPDGQVLSIDLDTDAIEDFKNSQIYQKSAGRVTIVHSNFRDIDKIVENHNFGNIVGIVADIGLSSYQLDQSGRGITFQKRELLDMRFDPTSKSPTAAYLLNNAEEKEILHWLNHYGEEPEALKITRKINDFRKQEKFRFTDDLVGVIKDSLPKPIKHLWADHARRVFQAIRIAVNHELEALEDFLPKAFDLVNHGGRIVIVSFHSLEDRIVKQFFQKLSKGCICPPDFPICICGKNPECKILTNKPIIASVEELKINPRSKSAKLRSIEKI